MQNLARDVVVQLKLKHSGERVIVIIRRRIVDMRFASGVAKLFATWFGRLNALKIADVFPPARIPLVRRQIVRIDVCFPVRHGSAGKMNEWQRAGERVIKQERGLIGIEFVRQNATRLQIRHLARRERDQFAYAFMESGRRSNSQHIWNLGTRVSFEVMTVPKLVVSRKKPTRIRLDALQRTNVVLKIDMPAGGVRVFLPVRIGWNRK